MEILEQLKLENLELARVNLELTLELLKFRHEKVCQAIAAQKALMPSLVSMENLT